MSTIPGYDLVLCALSQRTVLLLAGDDKVIASEYWSKFEGSEIIDDVPQRIQKMFSSQQLSWKNVRALYCAQGPGAFTGLRVSSSFMKGLSVALQLPLYGISTYAMYGEPVATPLRAAKALQMTAAEYAHAGFKFLEINSESDIRVVEKTKARLLGFKSDSETLAGSESLGDWPGDSQLWAGLERARQSKKFALTYGYAPEYLKIAQQKT